jgi:hypothetical protein
MKKIQVFFNYGIKNCVFHRSRYSSSLKAYALSEMANIERLRNTEQQITSAVNEVTNDFKQRIQSIISENQLSLSKK